LFSPTAAKSGRGYDVGVLPGVTSYRFSRLAHGAADSVRASKVLVGDGFKAITTALTDSLEPVRLSRVKISNLAQRRSAGR